MNDLGNLNAMQLTLKHVYLMQEIEQLPPGSNILKVRKEEAGALVKELRSRLHKLLVNSFFPMKLPVILKKDLEFIEHQKNCRKQIEGALKKEVKIPFHFDVLSSLNYKIDRFKVEAPTKEEAWKEAEKKAKGYPGKVNLKIS